MHLGIWDSTAEQAPIVTAGRLWDQEQAIWPCQTVMAGQITATLTVKGENKLELQLPAGRP